MNQGPQDLSSKYTIFPLTNPQHLQKLISYLAQFKDNPKTSYCRFYLRGLCIMKSQYCKFAHDFDELDIQNHSYEQVSSLNLPYGDKLLRKKIFIDKSDFYQRPLFFIKDLDYSWLYEYQFTERYKQSGIQAVSVKQINKQDSIRNRIREILHREQWDKMMNYIDEKYPKVDYPINFLSLWFGKLGFEKSQTFCKFGDFIRYIVFVRGYVEANIIVPPLTSRSVFFIKAGTYLHEHVDSIKQDCDEYRKEVKKIKEERKKKLPQNLEKRFICRFYMSGNCQKTRQECFYVHKIEDLRYDEDIQFEKGYRQPPKSMEERLNYVSLHRYYMSNKREDEPAIQLLEINSKFGLKDKIRRQVHLQMYRDFLAKLEEIQGGSALNLHEVKKEYTRFGFNHTDENKFGQLNSSLWQLGYHEQDIVNLKGEKKTFIYKIPPLEQINELYFNKISKILREQINLQQIKNGEEDLQILQSSIRRLIYSNTNKQLFEIPLHVYLRKRHSTLKEVIEQLFPEYVPYIFFESSQENFKKLIDLLKKYFKKHKKFIYKMEEIDGFIRGLTKQEINMNNFVNLKGLLELGLMQLGKEIYFWPMSSASIIIDRSHFNKDQIPEPFRESSTPIEVSEQQSPLEKEWAVVVDDSQKVKFCKKVMSHCNIFGVDLEGRLCQNGYIDLLQISCRTSQKKYIFVIDMHLLKKQAFELYQEMQVFIKEVFQSQKTLKILHACQQDSIALDYCFGVKIKNVFDTSGVDIYLWQKKVYEEMRRHNQTFEHTLKKIHASKTPGLNHVLEKWGAPKGINELKEQMKKVFSDYPRSYFTKRPIDAQFLTYSARDVEDLIEVWQNMHKLDPEGVWKKISQIYTATP